MRLVPKLALALVSGVFFVVAIFTAIRVHGEIELFDEDARRDQRLIAVTASAALAQTRTREDAIRLARRVDASRENMEIRYVSFDPQASEVLRPKVPPVPGETLERGAWKQVVHRASDDSDDDYLVTYVGAPVVDEPLGAIQLVTSLAPRAAYVSRGVWSVIGSSLGVLAVCGLIVASIGARMVGKPVAELIAATRRIGAGIFEVPELSSRKDEFGEIARAMGAMSADLEAARLRTLAETEARLRALEQLRHAERLATLGQLASVLAHELGTPLNVVAGHAKMIGSGRLDASGVQESSDTIRAQCERMTKLVRRILDYARPKPPKRTWIDATEIVTKSGELLGGLAQQRKVTLALPKSAEEVRVFADPEQLQQAITNLVMNAVQASRPGQSVEIDVGSVVREDRESQRFAVISVSDRGRGISEEVRARMFEPFYTTKPPGEGTGLGLSIVADVVREHGGFVEVFSKPELGSKFSIHLPLEVK
jgi:two-component system NtrC family sensor kinase